MEIEVVVVVASRRRGAGAAITRSSAARVPQTLSRRLSLPPGCYIQLQRRLDHPRFFRVAVDQDDNANGIGRKESEQEAVLVDDWPYFGHETGESATLDTFEAALQVVSPARLRVAQYVALSPATAEPPKLPLAMAKVLLKKTILHSATGVLPLVLQGVDYGAWRYEAYYKARSGTMDGWLLDAGIINDDTMVAISPFSSSETNANAELLSNSPGVGIHGQPLRNLLSLAMRPRADTERPTKIIQPRSILLHGPSGSGKTTLVQLIAKQLNVNVLRLDPSILATPHFHIEDVFTAALRIQPCLLLMDDLELIFPRALDETKYKLVCRFVACLDRIRSMVLHRVAVVGNVTSLRALNVKIRQVFEEELALEVPDKAWTVRLLESLLPTPQSISDELKLAVAVKFGQRPSHIVTLVKRLLDHDSLCDGPDAPRTRSQIERFGREIATASSSTQALRTSVPDVLWTDIGGLASVKQNLLEMVVWPLEKPEVFVRMGISPPLGMLLYGPPGTGKTMLAKAAARASGCNFLNVAASDLMKAEFGESEKAITRVFDTARALSPCMVFIDEFQSLFGNRTTAGVTTSRMISQLLVEMDALRALAEGDSRHKTSTVSNDATGASGHVARNRVFVLAATNALNAIDPAFLQPGRFENILHVGLPSMDERHAILQLQQKKMPWHVDIDIAHLAKATDGANAASIVALCQAAAIQAMQRIDATADSQLIEMEDFLVALQNASFDFSSS